MTSCTTISMLYFLMVSCYDFEIIELGIFGPYVLIIYERKPVTN